MCTVTVTLPKVPLVSERLDAEVDGYILSLYNAKFKDERKLIRQALDPKGLPKNSSMLITPSLGPPSSLITSPIKS